MLKGNLKLIFFISLFTGLVSLASFWWTRPTVLRLAVAIPNIEMARFATTFALNLRRDSAPVRVRVTNRETTADVRTALSKGEVELGIIRNDQAFPANMSVVAIVQKNPIVLLAPVTSAINAWTALPGKKIGVFSRSTDQPVQSFERLLREYEIDPKSVIISRIPPGGSLEGLDGLVLTGPPEADWVREAENAYAKIHEGRIKIVQITESEAIARRAPIFEPFTIVAGAYGGNPSRPSLPAKTSAISYVLIASNDLNEKIVGDLAQELFTRRAALAMEHPAALRIQAPDTEINASFPVHPGAFAYFTDNRQSFIERYGDVIYIALMFISLFGSLGAGLIGYLTSKNNNPTHADAPFKEFARLLKAVRTADEPALAGLHSEGEDIYIASLELSDQEEDPDHMNAVAISFNRLSLSVAERRRALKAA
jgi:TRAP-type uncharacterized transport system substrate-binding protein